MTGSGRDVGCCRCEGGSGLVACGGELLGGGRDFARLGKPAAGRASNALAAAAQAHAEGCQSRIIVKKHQPRVQTSSPLLFHYPPFPTPGPSSSSHHQKQPTHEIATAKMPGFDFSNHNRNLALHARGIPLPKATSTGTTIVGCIYDGGVVIAADTRATSGPIVADKVRSHVPRLSA